MPTREEVNEARESGERDAMFDSSIIIIDDFSPRPVLLRVAYDDAYERGRNSK